MSAAVAIPVLKFNGGEIDPKVRARTDLDWQGASLEILLNAIAEPQGPASMRPGTWHAGKPRSPANPTPGTTRVIGFVAGVDPLETYVVELTDQMLRFWIGGSRQIVGGATPLEVASPYLAAHLRSLRSVQSRDVMWLMHPLHKPRKLKRTSPTMFTLEEVDFVDGPYFPENITATTLTSGATAIGSTTLVASADLFSATDVGRLVRMGSGDTWGYGVITAFTDAQNVTWEIKVALPGTGPMTTWRLGLWSDTTGWPSSAVFWQERLFFGSTPQGSFPRADGSASGDFDNFKPGSKPADAVAYVLGAGDLPVIRDLIADRALVVTTSSGETKLGHEQATEAMTPDNPPIATSISTEGALDAPALKLKRGSVFIQRYGRSLHEIAYAVDADGLQTRDIAIRAAHMGDRAPFAGMCWQNRPNNVIWIWSQNGNLAGCTYTPEQAVIAWHRHRMGGRYRGGKPRVESMCSIPGTAADEVWSVVQRTINGQDVRHIDVFADALHVSEPQDEAVYLDASVRQRGAAPAANVTFGNVTASTARLTADAAVFEAGHVGKRLYAVLEDLDDEAADGQPLWRRVVLEISAFVSSTIVDVELVSPWIPPSLVMELGTWRFGITKLAGLGHLEGETIGVLADGGGLTPRVVHDGEVELDSEAAMATGGLLYGMVAQPVGYDAGARAGTSHTKRQQVSSIGVEVVRSGPFKAGIKGNLFDANVRTASDPMNEAVGLLTGVHTIDLPQGEDERRVRWRIEATGPLPVTIACAVPHQSIGEAVP